MKPVILISGATSTIGKECAVNLSFDYQLVLHGRDHEKLLAVRSSCFDSDKHFVWVHDFSDVDGIEKSLGKLLVDNGLQVEKFIHCVAEISILPARAIDFFAISKIMNINFASAIIVVATLVKKKINAAALNNVLFVSSIFSRFGCKAHTLYSASKAALDAAMRAFAVELAPRVRVNSLLLGAVDTPMASLAFNSPSVLEALKRDYPLGVGTPDAVADVVSFMVSDKSRWITGQEIIVDGGRSVEFSHKS